MTATRPEAPPVPAPLAARYRPEHLHLLTDDELRRLGVSPERAHGAATDSDEWRRAAALVAWDLLYRAEPTLYERLVSGERLHDGILGWFPEGMGRVCEVGPGTGRLTFALAPRADEVLAVEPSAAMRDLLGRRLRERGLTNVRVAEGDFHALPAPDRSRDVVVACSSFTVDEGHGGEPGLAEMERVCEPGGIVVVVWPTDPGWLVDRGYRHEVFDGPMEVDFGTVAEALELAAIFYPHAVDEIVRRGSGAVPYEVLGVKAPRDLCWKRMEA